MGQATKTTCFASQQDQSCRVWEGSLSKGLGDAEGSTNPNLDLKLGISNIYSSQAARNHYNNHTLDQAQKNPNNGSCATPDSGVSINPNQANDGQASKPDFDLKLATKIEDPESLEWLVRNRIYSNKYRMKKMVSLDRLEKLSTTLPGQISNICQKIQETQNMKQSLLIEQHQLKLQIAAFEKERILKEVEIGKNMAEVNRLRELQMNQMQTKQNAMRNSDDGLPAVNAQLDLNIQLPTKCSQIFKSEL